MAAKTDKKEKPAGRISLEAGSFVSGRKAVVIPNGKTELTLYVRELGYLEFQELAIKAQQEGKGSNALMIAATVSDKEGNQFTYEEAKRLKKAVAEPLLQAVIDVSGLGGTEKN